MPRRWAAVAGVAFADHPPFARGLTSTRCRTNPSLQYPRFVAEYGAVPHTPRRPANVLRGHSSPCHPPLLPFRLASRSHRCWPSSRRSRLVGWRQRHGNKWRRRRRRRRRRRTWRLCARGSSRSNSNGRHTQPRSSQDCLAATLLHHTSRVRLPLRSHSHALRVRPSVGLIASAPVRLLLLSLVGHEKAPSERRGECGVRTSYPPPEPLASMPDAVLALSCAFLLMGGRLCGFGVLLLLLLCMIYELAERSDDWAAPLYEKITGRERVRGAREVRVLLVLGGALIAYRPVSNSPRACGLGAWGRYAPQAPYPYAHAGTAIIYHRPVLLKA